MNAFSVSERHHLQCILCYWLLLLSFVDLGQYTLKDFV